MTTPPRTLPLSFADAREVVAELIGPAFVVREDGYEDDSTYLVPYEERDGPSWDLDIITVEKATGWVARIPWFLGKDLPDRMRPVTAAGS